MPNNLSHFAIYVDDTQRARRFYEGVFGWKFQALGPPDFLMITTGNDKDPGVKGALQQRRYNCVKEKVIGFECTITVSDLNATIAAVENAGGKIVMPKCAVPGVCWLFKFLDTEGNLVVAAQYDKGAE